tara:strand:- start:108976 stop:109437 length:462 start_codon:yes stop_codon:yes gene_type:complete
MTGDDLKGFRTAARLSRRALADLADLHPDTVRYWERKARVNLRGWAMERILNALGKGELVQRHIFPARPMFGDFLATMRARDRVLFENGKHRRRQTCGARTRKGTPCRARAINGKKRCKFHGGMSTGPKTPEGRARIAEAQRKRWDRVSKESG